VDDAFHFSTIANDSWIADEALNVVRVVFGDARGVKAVEGVADAGPLLVDHGPGNASLEDGLGHGLQIVVELYRPDLRRRAVL
jgi:hypothetical protein